MKLYSIPQNNNYLIPIIFAHILFLTFHSCGPKKIEQPSETLVARIGDKSISVNEFIRRAEYTIRPTYCRSEYPVHRKIVLNSLIAEKLLALEAGNTNKLTENFEYREYLKGRKEQAMRQWNYKIEALDKVDLTTNEVEKSFNMAGRSYRVSFLNLPNQKLAQLFEKEINKNKSQFEQAFKNLVDSDSIPEKQISWSSAEPDIIHDALFSDSLKVGQIIGPLKIDASNYLVMHINGYTNKLAVSENQVKERWDDVQEKLIQKKGSKIYTQYIKKIMRGKTIAFNEATFKKLVNIIGPEYYKSEEEKKESYNRKFWNKDNEEMILDDLQNQLEEIKNDPLFTIDNKTWTVSEYEVGLLSHPLVFRTRNIPKGSFAEEFKLAIVDMIRNRYITQDCYDKGLDKVNVVKRDYEMWKDNLLSLYQKYQYLDSVGSSEKDQLKKIEKYLNPYVMELHKKYNDIIEINTDEFENIKLTGIDMFVVQRNMPFPIIVPSFPQITTYETLDYGKKLEAK